MTKIQYLHTLNTHNSFHSKFINMASNKPASESLTGEGTINIPRSACLNGDDPMRCPDNAPNSFFLNFCNIRGLHSNFPSVEHHLSSSKPHLLFLTETQLSEATDSNLYSVPSYILYSQFQSKAGCCAYVRIYLVLVLMNLNLLNFLRSGLDLNVTLLRIISVLFIYHLILRTM